MTPAMPRAAAGELPLLEVTDPDGLIAAGGPPSNRARARAAAEEAASLDAPIVAAVSGWRC